MKNYKKLCGLFLMWLPLLLTTVCNGQVKGDGQEVQDLQQQELENEENMELETATFGGGCFWCTEAVFQELKGVKSVVSAYTGGATENPTYEDICTGRTGHAEVIQIKYDPEVISFQKLLEVHMITHDPTTLNRQGADTGTQYRSAIFYHTPEQRDLANAVIDKLEEARVYNTPIVTEVTEVSVVYPAEDYHQNYFAENPNQGYCRGTIPPKLAKLKKVFADLIKEK